MLYYDVKNYEEFQTRFGTQKHGNGVSNKKNKILLTYIKNKELLHTAVTTGNAELITIPDMTELKKTMNRKIQESGEKDENLPHKSFLNGLIFYSNAYSTDDYYGVCEDGDMKSVRYINHANGRVYKMKAGKYYRSLVLQTAFGKKLPEQVLVYLCEEFAADWQTYTMGKLPKNSLVVNKDFERIYSNSACVGDFQSCMMDKYLHSFYQYSVDASAAYLTNEDKKVIARCIIYNKVTDQDGNKWRLAERQYASDGNDVLKRVLIDALIKENHIDGYKKIGAGCGDSRAFVDTEGNSLSEKEFEIECNLDYNDTLSYQDSFKWYNEYSRIATNYENGDISLDITDGSINGDEQDYDDYHDYHCASTIQVFVHNAEYYCDSENMDDFIYIGSLDQYHHEEDVSTCEKCGDYYLSSEGYYSDLIEEGYCCKDCKEKAEQEYKENHWFYSDYDQAYYRLETELTTYQSWNPEKESYEEKSIHTETLNGLLENKEFFLFEDTAFDNIDMETLQPYMLEAMETTV